MTGADAIWMERQYALLREAVGELHDAWQDDEPDRALGILGDLEGIVGEVRARIGQRVGMALAGQLRGCATIMAHDENFTNRVGGRWPS